MHSSLFPFAPISNRPSENKLPEASNGRTARRRAVLGRVPRGGSLLGDSEYTHATRIGPTTPTQGDESLSHRRLIDGDALGTGSGSAGWNDPAALSFSSARPAMRQPSTPARPATRWSPLSQPRASKPPRQQAVTSELHIEIPPAACARGILSSVTRGRTGDPLSSDCGGAPLLRLLHVARRPGAHRHDFLTRLRRRKHSFTPPASPREPTNPAPPS